VRGRSCYSLSLWERVGERERSFGEIYVHDSVREALPRVKTMNKPRHYRGGFEYAGSLPLVRELRKGSTDAELLLWNNLRNRRLLGFKFRRQHQFGNCIADFYCHEAKLVIECDGGIHAKVEAWNHDQNRDAYFSSLDLRVLRFMNDEVLNETTRVLAVIETYLREAKPRATR
jgi:very-short-patch-repair endonuclease